MHRGRLIAQAAVQIKLQRELIKRTRRRVSANVFRKRAQMELASLSLSLSLGGEHHRHARAETQRAREC